MQLEHITPVTRDSLANSAGVGTHQTGGLVGGYAESGVPTTQQHLRQQLAVAGWFASWMQHNDVPRFVRSETRLAEVRANLDVLGRTLAAAADHVTELGGPPASIADVIAAAALVRVVPLRRSAVRQTGDAVRALLDSAWAQLRAPGGALTNDAVLTASGLSAAPAPAKR